MTKIRQIGISDFYVTDSFINLRTSGLGSCIGIILYDKVSQVGGLSHIMLPNSPENKDNLNRKKYCDTNIPFFLEKMLAFGAQHHYIKAAIFGGAEMFPYKNSPLLNIGKRNIESTTFILNSFNIPIIFQETGGSKGRTIEFNIETGEIQLRTAYEDQISFFF